MSRERKRTTTVVNFMALFGGLPLNIRNYIIFTLVGGSIASLATYSTCSRSSHALFQPQLNVLNLLRHVARGRQAEAEAMLIKAKKDGNTALLLQTSKIPITDWAGKETGEYFKDHTAFQIAVVLLDRHMYRMLLRYMPQQEAKKQFEGLLKNGMIKKLNYDVCLMTDEIASQKKLEEGKLYVRKIDGLLAYSVVALYGEIIIDQRIDTLRLPDQPFNLEIAKPLQANILQFAALRLHTDGKIGTLMTNGRRRMEKLKHRLKTYLDNIDRSYVQYKDSFSLEVGLAYRHLPAHVIHEYFYPERSLAPITTALFNEAELPRNTQYSDGSLIYPLRTYKRILAKDADAKIGTEIDSQTVVVKKQGESLAAYWTTSKAGIRRQGPTYLNDLPSNLASSLLSRKETQDKWLIAHVLFTYGCDSGVGFQFGLMRGNHKHVVRWPVGDSRCWKDHPSYPNDRVEFEKPQISIDLAALTTLCQVRSEKDLDELINDLYQIPSPSSCTIS